MTPIAGSYPFLGVKRKPMINLNRNFWCKRSYKLEIFCTWEHLFIDLDKANNRVPREAM